MEGDSETMCTLSNYCSLIRNRSKGTLMTNSAYMRKFVQEHEDYKRDSRVSEKISYDLLKHIDDIQSGKVFPPELFKDLKMKREEKKSWKIYRYTPF